ncbi:MAG: ABC transporter ATP-binding protein [Planctomycetota bacterium]|nr:ABC transporter ATP-binding protein [Planctomycetota bacterium]
MSATPAPDNETLPPAAAADAAPVRDDLVIATQDLAKAYVMEGGGVPALCGVSMHVRRGEFVSIMGQSGSGKSTLLHVLGCLHRASGGSYRLDGIEVTDLNDDELSVVRNQKIGFVFQKFNLLPHEDIVENVALPLVYARQPRHERLAAAKRMLQVIGLGDRLHHKPGELSGGQSQRVAIARALVTEPAVILADEPTGNLDSVTGLEIMALFQALHRAGRTIVQVTHDREKAEYGQRIIHLKDGLISEVEVVVSPRRAEQVVSGVEVLA